MLSTSEERGIVGCTTELAQTGSNEMRIHTFCITMPKINKRFTQWFTSRCIQNRNSQTKPNTIFAFARIIQE